MHNDDDDDIITIDNSSSSTACIECSSEDDYESSINNKALDDFNKYWVLVISPIALILNGVVLVTFFRAREILPSTTRLLMIHQAYIEVCSCSLAILQQLSDLNQLSFPTGSVGLALCSVYNASYWAFDTCSQLNCVLITLDRYFAICFVLRRVLTVGRVIAMIILTQFVGWTVTLLQNVFFLHVDPFGQCSYTGDMEDSILWGSVFFGFEFAPIVALCAFYPQMVYSLVQSSKGLHSLNNSGGTAKLVASKRLIRTGFAAALLLGVCNLPDNVLFFIMSDSLGDNAETMQLLQQATDISFKAVYPIASALIYSFSTARFRQAALAAFGCSKA